MKFILLVEGDTEAKALPGFLKKWLDPQLPQPVKIDTVPFNGWSALMKDVAAKAKFHLHGPKSHEIIAVIALLDLYGPTFYPAHLQSYQERSTWAKAHIENEIVKQTKFFQFFAVHEIEAWLLSDPDLFPPDVKKAIAKIKAPETINCDEPPAKLLDRLYKNRYKKVIHGKMLFAKLDPELAYAKCPHLKAMLDKMLELAKAAG